MAATAFWQVTAFNNVTPSGTNAVGIKCNTRVPLFGSDGTTPMVRRLRDANGRQVGDPVPLKPQGVLRIIDQHIQLA